MRRAARIDNTAKALTAHAKALGFTVYTINGALDCVLAWGTKTACIDWKSPNGTLTEAQAKLIASGFPVRIIATPEQLEALKGEMSR